ncbi:MAG TPA: DPP IV N-terminal domain-containing protein, partial [Chitinophagaceae bacterium]|nr:DPP IV N-terminal domain-containing protein [Chitinophagaceae bacterium]
MKRLLFSIISFSFILLLNAQDALTAKDYQQAESFLGYNTQQFIDRGNVSANWYAPDKFWYRTLTPDGSEFIVVDASRGTKLHAFDHAKLAASLSSATGRAYKASMLPFQFYNYSADGKSIIFRADSKQWKCDLQGYACAVDTTKLLDNAQRGQGFGRGNRGLEVISPDGTKAVYIKDYNLFARDVKTGKITQLTTDGIKDFGYATDNAGWTGSDRPVLRWSP